MLGDADKVENDFGPQAKEEWVNWYLIDYNYARVVRLLASSLAERKSMKRKNALKCQASKSSEGVNLLRFKLTHPIPHLII